MPLASLIHVVSAQEKWVGSSSRGWDSPVHGDRGRSLCQGQETDIGTSHTLVIYSEHLSFASKMNINILFKKQSTT